MRITLDEAIARLQDLRTKVPGETLVAVRGHGPGAINYVDAIGGVKVGKSYPYRAVSRGGVPIVMIWGQ